MSDFLKPASEPAKEAPDGKTENPAAVADPAPASSAEPAKAESTPKAEPEKPAADGEKPEDIEKLQKRLKDTQTWGTTLRQQNVEMQKRLDGMTKQMDVLMKKIDGTYDAEKDAPAPLKPDEIESKAAQKERIATSHYAALEMYGEDYVQKTVWADDAPFRKFDGDPAVQARVMASKLPVLEAIRVVKEAATKQKYGSDPEAMRKAIAEEVRKELEKEITAKLTKEMRKTGSAIIEEVRGLGEARSVVENNGKPADTPITMESLFPQFVK